MAGAPEWIRWSRLLPRAAVVAARRPASWISAGVAASAVLWASWARLPTSACLFVAVLACLAALGDLPTGLLPPGGRGRRAEIGVWAAARGLWPLVGACLALLVAGRQASLPAAWCGAAVVVAMVSVVVSRSCGAKAADAAAVVVALASMASAAAAMVPGAALAQAAAAGLVWLAVGGLAWAWWRTDRGDDPLAARMGLRAGRWDGELTTIDPLPSSGTLRQWLGRLAMLTALVGMAAWLVPAAAVDAGGTADGWIAALPRPLHGVLPWAAATAVWFLALAVPQAILQDGVAGAGARDRFMRTAPVVGNRPRLGAARFAVGPLVTHAAVLGWPPLVAAILSLPSTVTSIPPLTIVVALLVGAGGVMAIVAAGARLGASQETRFALVLAVASLLVMGAWQPRPVASAPISPSPPSLGASRP